MIALGPLLVAVPALPAPPAGVTLAGVPGIDAAALAPVIAPVVALLLVLLVDAAAPGGHRLRALLDGLTLAGLGASAVAVAWLAQGADRSTACLLTEDSDSPLCSFVVSGFTLTVQAVVLVAAIGCLLLTLNGPGAQDRTAHHVLLLSAVAGAVALAGARDLATLVIALETVTLPTIALVGLRKDAQGAQAAVTMLLTAVASLGLLLLGVALVYLATGTLHLDAINTVLSDPSLPSPVKAVAGLGATLMIAGIGFKVSLVPFHLWTPDTYAGAPLPIAALLSTVSKAAGVAALALLLGIGLPAISQVWVPIVGILAMVTMTVGNVVALRQRVAVRLLAWSTVAQAGWVMLPFASIDGTPESVRAALSASAGYLLAYVVAGLAAFAVVVLVARHHPSGEEHTLDVYRGLARTEPVAAAILAFALACLAGLPPGVMGLVAKVVALKPVVQQGVWLVAVVAALNVALGLAYYLRWAGLLVAGRAATIATVPAAATIASAPAAAVTASVPGAAASGSADADPEAPGPEQAPASQTMRWTVRPAEGLALGGAAAGCVVLSLGGQIIAALATGILH
jgi:NADH-quinone oxidoreductase subunit N